MSSIGTTTAAEVFSERVELQPRTSDPSSTEEGEGWIRSDIAPDSNQIATFRVDTGGSTIDVPILQAGTAQGGVVEALRLSVGGTVGYVPAIAESKAAFPALRLQHNGQVYGWHDARGETAFFDVAITATNSPVDDGETLTVDYSVQNTGGALDNTQDIRLDVASTERDRDSAVTIASGTSTTGQLSWGSASKGSYTASVVSDDDSASTSVSVEPAIPDSVVYGFESGDVSNWNVSSGATFTASNSRSASGTYSGYASEKTNSGADYVARAEPYEEAVEWSSFSYSFNETTTSIGHTVRVLNSNGDDLLRLGSSNISVEVYDNNGRSVIDNGWDDYKEWISLDVSFDWQDGTFIVTASDGSNSDSYSGDLINSGGFLAVEIWCADKTSDLRNEGPIDDYYDDFEWSS